MSLRASLAELARPAGGRVGVVVRPLDGAGETIEVAADHRFTAASLIKLPILAAALDSGVPLDERLPVRPAVPGSGVLAHLADVGDMSVRDLLTLMIAVSDNTATNVLIDRIGRDEVNAWCARHGLTATVLARHMMDFEARARGLNNLTSAADVATALSRLADSPFAVRALEAQQFNDRLPRHLPTGFRLAHKTGELTGVRHDAGIVYPPAGPPVVVAALTEGVADGAGLIAECGRLVFSALTRS
ncbi:serine hydrolase [Actinoallomurus iriomotensis]|uniref:Serine hydrolase n=1 Tax=Actinoallomurus iriomotensis TaxID=478107 RepID=A0A9W6RJ05_9ACTN|nr:serine hydrolase [Actinoallomurus iriomotensis]GLY75705.1 serine hydrolase [Actinoallomurus iriomotensis]